MGELVLHTHRTRSHPWCDPQQVMPVVARRGLGHVKEPWQAMKGLEVGGPGHPDTHSSNLSAWCGAWVIVFFKFSPPGPLHGTAIIGPQALLWRRLLWEFRDLYFVITPPPTAPSPEQGFLIGLCKIMQMLVTMQMTGWWSWQQYWSPRNHSP